MPYCGSCYGEAQRHGKRNGQARESTRNLTAARLTPVCQAATIASWMQRLDEEGASALVQIREPVNKLHEFARDAVQHLKVLCPGLSQAKIADKLCRASAPPSRERGVCSFVGSPSFTLATGGRRYARGWSSNLGGGLPYYLWEPTAAEAV